MAKTILIGIDEAGRGPLAGPVAVGAFAVNDRTVLKRFRGVKDSKQLSEKQRDEWMKVIRRRTKTLRRYALGGEKEKMGHTYTVSFSSARFIDKHGISEAIKAALAKCLEKLERRGFAGADAEILLDGSLRAPTKYKNQKTIIGGDAKEPIIAIASICAKVSRDRLMKRLGGKYPNYGFETHKGYGTKAHYRSLKENGASPEHRLTFL